MSSSESRSLGGLKILVVDDSPPTCLYLKRLLEKKGYQVVTAADGAIGARMAMELLPDLILLDLNLPKRNGREVLADVMAAPSLREIPVVVLRRRRHP